MPYDAKNATIEIAEIVGLEVKQVPAFLFEISHYLGGGPTTVLPGLQKLEQALEVEVGKDNLGKALDYFSKQKDRELAKAEKYPPEGSSEPRPFSKLLSKHMSTLEAQHGFNSEMYSTFLKGLAPGAFIDDATKNGQFKDLVSPAHGEYTHRLQFYLLLQEKVIPAPGKKVFEGILKTTNLWNYLFDRDMGTDSPPWGKEDFRKPEWFNDYLIGSVFASKCPLLGTFFKGRREKRDAGPSYSNNQNERWNYIARKMFKKNLESCSPEEQEKVKEHDTVLARSLHA